MNAGTEYPRPRSEPSFTMTGFKASGSFRVFEFQRMAADGTRAVYTVRADLSLIHQHGIQMQDLPLLCRELLDGKQWEHPEVRDFTFTGDEMSTWASDRAAGEIRNKALRKSSRTPSEPEETFRNPGAMPATARSNDGGWR